MKRDQQLLSNECTKMMQPIYNNNNLLYALFFNSILMCTMNKKPNQFAAAVF